MQRAKNQVEISDDVSRFSRADLLFLTLIAWPYRALPPQYNIAAMLSIAAVALLVIGFHRFRIPWSFYLFSIVVLIHTVVAVLSGGQTYAIYTHGNHFWQFVLLYPAALYILRHSNVNRVLSSWQCKLVLLVSTVFGVAVSTARYGVIYYHEFDLPTLFLLISFVFFPPVEQRKWVSAVLSLGLATGYAAVMTRTSAQALVVLALITAVVSIPKIVVRALAVFIAVAPVLLGAFADVNTLRWLIDIDHNTYIRAEFIRAALPDLMSQPLTGTGLLPPYREVNFNFVQPHPLLTSLSKATVVSNHHSYFDTALRLGLLGVLALFSMTILVRWPPAAGRGFAFVLLALAVGLSLNAWFENQSQLPIVIVLCAVLADGRIAGSGRLRRRAEKFSKGALRDRKAL